MGDNTELMYVLTYVLLVFVIAYSLRTFWKIRFENSVIIGQGFIIGFLYLFYLANILEKGVWVLLILLFAMFTIAIYHTARKKRIANIVKEVTGYSFGGYCLYLIAAFLTVRNKVPFWGDELRYWAAVPKVLYRYHGALQLDNGFQMFSVDYIPGISIYQYFLEYLNGTWSDSLLFFAYAAITGALILPAGKRIKTWHGALALASLLYFVPLFFFHTKLNDYAVFYQSLYVDPMVGVAAGMVVWLCIGKPWEKGEDFTVFISTSTFLVLLKSSGIVFVIIAAVTMIIYIIVTKQYTYIKKPWIWGGILLPVVLWELWNIALDYYSITNELNYSFAYLLEKDFIWTFAEALVKKQVLTVWLRPITKIFTFAVCLVILTILITLLMNILKKCESNDHKYKRAVVGMLYFQMIVYVFGLYGLCAGTFEGRLNSYSRYISTVLEMMLCFFCCELFFHWRDVIDTLSNQKIAKRAVDISVSVLLFVLILPIRHVNNTANTYPDYIIEDRLAVSSVFTDISDSIPQNEWMSAALLFDEPSWESESWLSWAKQWYGHLLNNVSYESIGYGIQIRQASYYDSEMDVVEVSSEEVICTLKNDREWADLDYICMCHGNYVETPIHNWELYKVIKKEGKALYLQLLKQDSKPEEFVNYHVEG